MEGTLKKSIWLLITFFLFTILISGTVKAIPDRVISNSNNWEDVYSTLLYANLLGVESNFLVSTAHSTLLLYSIPKDQEIEVISSSKNRYIVGYDEIILNQGYPDTSVEKVFNNVNLDLAKQLTDINKYIIVDSAYGYNALSVAPFAVVANYYVLFADDKSINRVANFLEGKNVEKILLYGNIDRSVKDRLAVYNPEIINEGDRFDNNFAIVKKYLEVKPTKQAILSSGEFIEASMLSGFDPIIFIGKSNVPQKVKDFIDRSNIDIGILIGNELVGVATTIRREVGISVFVKFAQGARKPTGSISQVEDLDRFPMPSYSLAIDIDSVIYNSATRSLEVTYKNLVGLSSYVKSTINLDDGGNTIILADDKSFFLEGDEVKTIIYDTTVNGDELVLLSDKISGNIFSIFGEATNALEFQLSKDFEVEFIDIRDDSMLQINDVSFDKSRKRFNINVENIGKVDLYATGEIYDLVINGDELSFGSGDKPLIPVGGTGTLHVDAEEFVEQDYLDNPTIFARVFYGQRESSLIKIAEAEMPLNFTSMNYVIIIIVIVIILLFLLLFFWRRKCKHCKTKNYLWKTRCKKCKARL